MRNSKKPLYRCSNARERRNEWTDSGIVAGGVRRSQAKIWPHAKSHAIMDRDDQRLNTAAVLYTAQALDAKAQNLPDAVPSDGRLKYSARPRDPHF